jgi:nucleoside-diphosphate-sugar epimerase
MNAMVTGSSGFLGRHFTKYLNEQGWLVSPVDIDTDSLYPQDARDVFRRWSGPWDLLIHCAAVVNGRQTIENSPVDQFVDFELDAAMFRWAIENGVKKVVYFSSSAAYPISMQKGPGVLQESDIDLKQPALPDALYGWTKLTGEMLARDARRAGLDVLVVRPFSGYGSDQDDCYPFPAIMKRALQRDDPFVIWGSGMQVRDFVHVDDIVGAVMAFLDAGIEGPVNIGTGVPTSMSELARMASEQCWFTPKITPLTNEPEGVLHRVADTRVMGKFYQPRVTLEEGVAEALRALAVDK